MTDSVPQTRVLMLLASGCAHCPVVLSMLTELLKNGDISTLEAINISQRPDIAQQYHVRSVPWLKIGEIELTGLQTKAEILQAIEQSLSASGTTDYYSEMLNNGQLQEAIDHIRKHPDNLAFLLEMLQQTDIKISLQIGIGAIMEEFARSAALNKLVPALSELTRHPLPRVRNDACFYLSLSSSLAVSDIISPLLNDPDDDVRETARDCLEDLQASP